MVFIEALLYAQPGPAYYEVIAPEDVLDFYSSEMEQRFTVFNRIFRFDPASLIAPLRVRVFNDKEQYDTYVSARLGEIKPGAVYLHFRRAELRELVIHEGSEEKSALVPHQAFIQFLRAFIPEAPPWIREGFALYFNSLVFNRMRDVLIYEENLSWLDTAKNLDINPETVLMTGSTLSDGEDLREQSEVFQAAAWSLVSFFMAEENSIYRRALTDSFMVLSPAAGAEENTQAVFHRLLLFHSIESLSADFTSYIAGRRTFAELITEGHNAYSSGQFSAAQAFFNRAAGQRSTHYAPYYYLGLLAYEEKRYEEADALYQLALDYGAPRALLMFARGLNAAADGKNPEAIVFLEEAALDERYRTRSEELISRLQ